MDVNQKNAELLFHLNYTQKKVEQFSNNNNASAIEPLLTYDLDNKPSSNLNKPKFFKYRLVTILSITSIPLFIFIIIFVILPTIYRCSVNLQRNLIFPTWSVIKQNYSDIEAFNISGIKNFYLNTGDSNNVTIGLWEILPADIRKRRNDEIIFQKLLKSCRYDILLYFHGNKSDRTTSIPLYKILIQYFHVFAVDYRGYGDSTSAPITKTGIVTDMVAVYKWLNENSYSRIFIWGHSMGTAVATHLISELKKENLRPAGLILETPFKSVLDIIALQTVTKIFSWLPWCDYMFLDPIKENDLDFNPREFIKLVDCPIMILHAKDDSVVPYEHANAIYETAITNRNTTVQGNVTYHLFEAVGYGHNNIYQAPELPDYILDFVEESYNYEEKMEHLNSTFITHKCKMNTTDFEAK